MKVEMKTYGEVGAELVAGYTEQLAHQAAETIAHLKQSRENLIASQFSERNRPDVMVDIETMGLTPRSCVLSIGAVAFNRHGNDTASTFRALSRKDAWLPSHRYAFYCVLELKTQQDIGRGIDGDTMKWWMSQGDKAREVFAANGLDARESVNCFRLWLAERKAKCLWANPTTFDVPILESLFRDLKMTWPFNHRQYRDLKTLQDVTGFTSFDWPIELVAHNALDDAIAQALKLQSIYRANRGLK